MFHALHVHVIWLHWNVTKWPTPKKTLQFCNSRLCIEIWSQVVWQLCDRLIWMPAGVRDKFATLESAGVTSRVPCYTAITKQTMNARGAHVQVITIMRPQFFNKSRRLLLTKTDWFPVTSFPVLGTGGGANLRTRWIVLRAILVIPSLSINPLTPNDPYRGRTAPLTSKRLILYIFIQRI
jgi:hypothetical protein